MLVHIYEIQIKTYTIRRDMWMKWNGVKLLLLLQQSQMKYINELFYLSPWSMLSRICTFFHKFILEGFWKHLSVYSLLSLLTT